jgi:hypothetical protein
VNKILLARWLRGLVLPGRFCRGNKGGKGFKGPVDVDVEGLLGTNGLLDATWLFNGPNTCVGVGEMEDSNGCWVLMVGFWKDVGLRDFRKQNCGLWVDCGLWVVDCRLWDKGDKITV